MIEISTSIGSWLSKWGLTKTHVLAKALGAFLEHEDFDLDEFLP